MNNNIGVDLTNSKVAPSLIKLLIPILLSNILNVVYNVADSIWIGNIIGPLGLSAIAVSFPIILIVGAFAFGINMASGVIVSQYYGAKDYESLGLVIKVSTTLSLFIVTSLCAAAFLVSKELLILMNTPKNAMDMALSYLRISILGFPFVYYYFLISSLLRAVGDTVRPLIFLIISSVINIVLDPILISGFWIIPKMGLKGAAIATVFSQIVSVVISFIYLKFKNSFIRVNPFKITFNMKVTKQIVKLALPLSSNQLIVALGWLVITRLISSFGEAASATVAVINRIESLFLMPVGALGVAVMTMAAQNIGASKFYRVKEIFKCGIIIGIIISSFMAIFSTLFPYPIIRVFTDDTSVFQYSKEYIYIIMPTFIIYSVMFVCNGIINGAGKTAVIMIFTAVSIIILRIPFAYTLSGIFNVAGIWASMGISYIISTIFSFVYYMSNRWKTNSNITKAGFQNK